MTSEREALFRQMVTEFPDAPTGHFSLGKLLLEEQRYAEATVALGDAVRLDGSYAAAWIALGDAHSALGAKDSARDAWARGLETPLGRRDLSLQADVEARLCALDEF